MFKIEKKNQKFFYLQNKMFFNLYQITSHYNFKDCVSVVQIKTTIQNLNKNLKIIKCSLKKIIQILREEHMFFP